MLKYLTRKELGLSHKKRTWTKPLDWSYILGIISKIASFLLVALAIRLKLQPFSSVSVVSDILNQNDSSMKNLLLFDNEVLKAV